MGFPSTGVRSLPATQCRLILRQEVGLSEILQFMASGLEIGQQVVAMAGPACLKDLASHLDECGLRSSMLLRSGRLVFLTAPECLPSILHPDAALNRGPLHRNGTMMRWLSDWSWAITGGLDLETVRNYQ